jgi:hypothetical protein
MADADDSNLPPLPQGAVLDPLPDANAANTANGANGANTANAGDNLPALPQGAILDPSQQQPAYVDPEGNPLVRTVKSLWSTSGAPLVQMGKTLLDIQRYSSGSKKQLEPETQQILQNIANAQHSNWAQTKQAFQKGDYGEAALHFLGSLPVAGPAMEDQWRQAIQAENEGGIGGEVESFGHALAGSIPFIGPAAAHAGETIGGTQPVFDKYGNVIQPGRTSDVAGGIGEGLGLVGPYAVSKGLSLLPRASRAATALDQVEQAAGHLPVDVNAPGKIALEAQQLARSGGRMPKVMSDFLRRVTDPNQPPLTFSEARNFYTNASKLSANETGNLTGPMLKKVGGFRAALNDSLTGGADQAGVGNLYRSGLKEYRQAMALKSTGQQLKGVAQSQLGKAIGVGAGGGFAAWLYNKLWGAPPRGGHAQGGPILDRYPSRESVVASLKRR